MVVNSTFSAAVPCPSPWTFDVAARGCRRTSSRIETARYDVPLAEYREVLLSATGSQYYSTDGFPGGGINEAYVDGLSITTTLQAQRAHVFTFAVGLTEAAGVENGNHCPCDQGSAPPAFVGTSYLCDTASPAAYPDTRWLDEVLWDGDAKGLGTCAATNGGGARWVTSSLPSASTAGIEARLMADQEKDNEDIAVRSLAIYVR